MRHGQWAALLLTVLLALPLSCAAEGDYGAWLPYWEAEAALQQAEMLEDTLDTAVVFSAVFDRDDRPFLTDEAEALWLGAQVAFAGTDTKLYLSVVNDRQLKNGKFDSKSKSLLEKLLKDDRAIDEHIDDLLMLVDSCEAEGLEIDYENLGSDRKLYGQFAVFIERLYEILAQDGIALRVVLQWDAAEYFSLPDGPEYTVMCYNLYGYHSGPGPKADTVFLDQIAALYADHASKVRMALAAGGFEWQNGRVSAALTQQEAEAILRECGVQAQRDGTSSALTAEYRRDGKACTLWYADGMTLQTWKTRLGGFAGIDLFSLGGAVVNDWRQTVLYD